jgi:peptidoglycan/LPS O-acetylase OafA/YrhL
MSRSLSGARAVADQAFMWGWLLFLVAGLVQIFLAGMGVFDLNGQDLDDATSLDPHRTLGFALGGLSLLLLILSVVARVDARTMGISLVVALLANLAQSILADAGDGTPFLGGLHALDGLAILGLGGYLFGQARRRNSTVADPARSS